MYLSKSDFKLARSCPTKLYYHKLGYPSVQAGSEFLELLAEGGYIVEAIAKLRFPDGVRVQAEADPEAANAETLALLNRTDSITLFEATLLCDRVVARADILVKRGRRIDLIEVKARSFDPTEYQKRIAEGKSSLFSLAAWRDTLEDVAFQAHLLRSHFPDFEIRAFLMLPDKTKPSAIDQLHRQFQVRRIPVDAGFSQIQVEFLGDEAALSAASFLTQKIDITAEVEATLPTVRAGIQQYTALLWPSLQRAEPALSISCRDCEYWVEDEAPLNGFRHCWGDLADVSPHLLDLYRVGSLGDRANELIQHGKVSLYDVTPDLLVKKDGSMSAYTDRQLRQLHHTREDTEWVSAELADILDSFDYPLHFIDMETCAPAIPCYSGMRPYETIAFQWSCHTLTAPNAEPQHECWLCTEDEFPNFAFAESLMQHLGSTGTPFMWSKHENTVLREVLEQMTRRSYDNPALRDWLGHTVKLNGDDRGRLVDLCQLTEKHYLHPQMRGSTSIKVVVEAIWRTNPVLRDRFPEYVRYDETGRLLSPYKALPTQSIHGAAIAVTEGPSAVRAYRAMVHHTEGPCDPATRDQWKDLLLQYCQLDTAAMVMIWWHWAGLLRGKARRG
ncbi:DUF2779 domain-containing protein [Thermoleptolyngbya sp. PKUAC-SCTB121]|uniref:DUF2779 domain-containing protein n=1 Tax=Thermoleptolyngbya sp. PKUAC-SCTB121 TaxID=2811482 RepID=UPI0019662941|nr:DUF2779 domain-containing protein [Thermoleptolyngbya sp. PKUAC-SCTB121]